MPVINVPNYGYVNFPDTMSEDELQSAYQRLAEKAAARVAYQPDYKNQGLGALAKAGLGRGLSGLGSTVTDVLPAMVGSALGYEDYAKQQMEEAVEKRRQAEVLFPTAYKSYKEIGGLGDLLGYGAETLGELTPDMLAMLTGGGAFGAIGKRLAVRGALGEIERAAATRAAETAAKRGLSEEAAKAYAERLATRAPAQLGKQIEAAGAAGARTGTAAGVYGTSLGLNAPGTFQGIYGETGELEPGIALTFGAVQAALDSLIPARLLSQFSPPARAKVAGELIDRSTVVPPTIKMAIAKELAKTTAGEGVTESAQELISLLAEKTAGAEGDIFSPENVDRLIEAGIKGAIGGTAFGIPGAVLEGRKAKQEADRIKAEQAAANEPPAPPADSLPTPEVPPSLPPVTPVAATPPVAETPAAPAAPAPTSFSNVPSKLDSWSVAGLQQTLETQLSKPEASQNKPLIAAIQAELARRAEDNYVEPPIPVTPQTLSLAPGLIDTESLTPVLQQELAKPEEVQNKPLIAAIQAELARRTAAPGAKDVGTPVVTPSGTSTTVAGKPSAGATPAGVGVPEPDRVVPPVADAGLAPRGEEGKPVAVEQAAPAAPVAPPPQQKQAPRSGLPDTEVGGAPAPEAVSRETPAPAAPVAPVSKEQLAADIDKLIAQKTPLMTSDGRIPFKNSPARKKYDAVVAELDPKLEQWRELTGASYAEEITRREAAKTAPAAPSVVETPTPPVAETPAPTPPAAPPAPPVAEAPTPPATPPAPKQTSDDLMTEIRGLVTQRMALLRADGKIPFPKSPARKKYDALVEQIADLKGRWDEADKAERAAKAKPEEPKVEAKPEEPKVETKTEEPKVETKTTKASRRARWTEAVTRWFGDSKVVDEQGEPLVVYRGADKDYGATMRVAKEGALGAGIYTTPNPEFASTYAEGEAGNVMPLYVSLQNPLILRHSSQEDPMVVALVQLGMQKNKAAALVEKAYEEKGYIGKQVMNRAQAQNYDGIMQYRDGKLSEVVAFNPAQIKSAISTNEPKVEAKPEEELTAEDQADLQAELAEEQATSTASTEEAPKTEPKRRGRPKKVLTEEEQAAKAKQQAEKEAKKAERETKKAEKAAQAKKEEEELAGIQINGEDGKPLTQEEIDEAKRNQARASAAFEHGEDGGYLGLDKDPVQRLDRHVVLSLISSKRKLSNKAKAAQAYFSKTRYAKNALFDLAFDVVNPFVAYRKAPGEGTVESNRFNGTGGENATLAAQWVEEKFTAEGKALFKKYVDFHARGTEGSDAFLEAYNAEQKQAREYEASKRADDIEEVLTAVKKGKKLTTKKRGEVISDTAPDAEDMAIEDWLETKNLFLDEPSKLALPLHPVVRHALFNGDLTQAINLLAAHTGGIGQLATMFSKLGIKTKVETVNMLTDADGFRVPGYYDPKTDTIYLDSMYGMNSHTLFHEIAHAVTSQTLDNPSHPLTKQLTQIYNDVKDSLDTAYGAQSLQEFAAETWSNEEFKAKLNSINPKGEKITAWQRFFHAIRNFFRRLMGRESVSIETAYDASDKLLKAIMAVAPESRDSEVLYAATVNPKSPQASSLFNSFFDAVGTATSQDFANNASQLIRDVFGPKARKLAFYFMPLEVAADVAKSALPKKMGDLVEKIGELVRARAGDENARNQQIDALVRMVEEWGKKHGPKITERLGSVIYDSTTLKIDPTRPRSYYENAFATAPAADLASALHEYDRMNQELKAIPGGRRIYTLIRDTYAKLYEEILANIDGAVNMATKDKDARAKIKQEFQSKLAERGKIDPYFPLTRNGRFWLQYTAKDHLGYPEIYVEAFESERERERAIKSLIEAGKSVGMTEDQMQIQRFSNLSQISYKNAPSSSFMKGIMQTLELHRPKDKEGADKFDSAIESVLRMYLSTLPETSFAKAFQKRKDTAGYSKDFIRALRERSFSMSRQLSNMKYAALLNDVRQDFRDEVEKSTKEHTVKDNKLFNEYYDEFDKRITFAISPTIGGLAQTINTVGFNYLLGLNLSSALVNLTQVPLIVLPYLGGKYGYADSQRALTAAYKAFMYKAFMGSGFGREVDVYGAKGEKATHKAMPSLDNYDFSDESKLPPEIRKYKTLHEVASRLGQFNRSMLFDALEVDGRKNISSTVNAVTGFAFHHGERMNREVSLMAAYELELKRLNSNKATAEEKGLSKKEKEERAAGAAIYLTEMTNGGSGAATAAPVAQNSVGRVLFMFKKYGVLMNYLLFKTVKEAVKGESPEVKKAAFKQIAGIMGSSAIFAGLQGMPLFGVVAMLYNLFKDDDDEDFGSVVRSGVGETFYKGLINEATGLSGAERIGLSNLLFRDSPVSTGSQTLADWAAQTLGGPMYGIASRMQRGLSMIKDGETQRGVENLMPVALANVMKSYRFATEGANTMRGDPIVGDIGPWNIAAQALGFTPAEYTRQLEQNALLKGIDKAVSQNRSKYLTKMNVARHLGDTDGYQEAYKELAALFAKHPGLGNVNDTIKSSQRQYDVTRRDVYHGITLSKKLREELMTIVEEQEN